MKRNSAPCRFCVLAVSAFIVQQCYAGKVKTEVGPGADFASYKTFQWLPPRVLTNTGIVEDHPLIPLIKEAVGQELSKLGLKEVAEGGDLQVSAGILTGTIAERPGFMLEGGSNVADTINFTPVAHMGGYNKNGTLVVNLIDTRTKKSAWVGAVTESIGKKPGSGQSKVKPAAAQLFKKYPTAK